MLEKNPPKNGTAESTSINLTFEDNRLLPLLFGEQDAHLSRIEKRFHVTTASRGNQVSISGQETAVEASRNVLQSLYSKLQRGDEIGIGQVDAAIRIAAHDMDSGSQDPLPGMENLAIKTMKKHVRPYSHGQANYIKSLQQYDLVFAIGPAGTGKTYLAVAMAVSMLMDKRVERIILSRPAVEAGEKLGFLPGDLKDKIDPYLRPLYDALFDMIPAEKVQQFIDDGAIEVAPLAFMRGRTLGNAYVILDESQNTTPTQMKMFLTRLGENSRMVVTGDLSQIDLPRDVKSGLHDALRKLEDIEGITVTRFTDSDVVRHPLAAKIVHAYDEWERKKKG